MKVELYQAYPGITKDELKKITIYLKEKMATFLEDFSDEDGMPIFSPESRFYDYEYDNSFIKEFGDLKLNYRFNFYPRNEYDDSIIDGLEGYAHLNYCEKTRLELIFQRNWFQKSENIKWIVSFLISFIALFISIASLLN